MKIADCVVKETLRMYPIVPMIPRTYEGDGDVVEGVNIKKGDLIFLSPYCLGRDPKYWQNPDLFDPSRFMEHSDEFQEGESSVPHIYPSKDDESFKAWIPFGFGLRSCIGMRFSMVKFIFFFQIH
jgi:cytochrome P450